MVRGDARAVPQPDAHVGIARAKAEIVSRAKRRQAFIDRGRTHVDGRRLGIGGRTLEIGKHRIEGGLGAPEIEP
jgi:hypothetical protein